MMTTLRPTLLLVLATVACSSSPNNPTDGGGSVITMGDYLPLKVGNNWTYKITDPDSTVTYKVQSVASEGLVGGSGPHADKTAFKIVTGNRINDPEGDVSYQAVVDGRVVRFRELSIDGKDGELKNETVFVPGRIRIDQTMEHTVMGVAWRDPDYTEHKTDTDRDDAGVSFVPDGGITEEAGNNDLWVVVSVGQKITVLGATYDTLQLRRTANRVGAAAYEIKHYWFAKGIGKVLETEEGEQKEELDSYSVH